MSTVIRRGRGRPAVYTGNVKSHIVGLIRKHNASNARDILNAPVDSDLASKRSAKIVPEPLNISMPTLLRLAANAGVSLHRGRPAVAA